MLLGARNAMGGGKVLPYDYEVSYIKTDGTNYFDTGYFPSSKTKMIMEYSCESYAQRGWGCLNDAGVARWHAGLHGGINIGVNASTVVQCVPYDGEIYTLEVDAKTATYRVKDVTEGVLTTITSDFNITRTFSFGARHYSTYDLLGIHKFHSLKFYEDGELKFDGLSVVKDGVACVYDSVSNSFKCKLTGNDFEVGERVE